VDVTTGFDSGFAMGASSATTNGSKEDDGFDLLSSRSTGNSPAKTSGGQSGLDGFDPLGGLLVDCSDIFSNSVHILLIYSDWD